MTIRKFSIGPLGPVLPIVTIPAIAGLVLTIIVAILAVLSIIPAISIAAAALLTVAYALSGYVSYQKVKVPYWVGTIITLVLVALASTEAIGGGAYAPIIAAVVQAVQMVAAQLVVEPEVPSSNEQLSIH